MTNIPLLGIQNKETLIRGVCTFNKLVQTLSGDFKQHTSRSPIRDVQIKQMIEYYIIFVSNTKEKICQS